jgi:hypothetical protein
MFPHSKSHDLTIEFKWYPVFSFRQASSTLETSLDAWRVFVADGVVVCDCDSGIYSPKEFGKI